MPTHQNPRDKPLPHTGKVQNDTSKMGEQHATPLNLKPAVDRYVSLRKPHEIYR
ncbi:MAG: hypothetical protein I8H87_13715 [Comamonadaceae bacterium]|jgi:hypothetical protein|nr:hypothetical protein [Comamonadaceae bacterium]